MFNLLHVAEGKLLDTYYCPIEPGEDKEPYVTDDGKHAARLCKDIERAFGYPKVQPRKVLPPDNTWKEREQRRMQDGTYKRPDYINQLERNPDHFLHLAEKRQGMLAYTKDPQKGMQDRQSVISLQGYIEEFYANIEAGLKAEIEAAHYGADLENDGLKFACQPDDIVAVYTNYACGPGDDGSVSSSCMRYTLDQFNAGTEYAKAYPQRPQHPCYVYGAGDLAVAYLTDDEGRTTQRAVCWPAKKIYTRVYGDARLHDLLRRRGYTKSSGYQRWVDQGIVSCDAPSFEGARLLRIPCPTDPERFLVPFCDDVGEARDDGKFLIIKDNGPIDIQNAGGWSIIRDDDDEDEGSEHEYTCGSCEEGCDETYTVYVSRHNNRGWCRDCRDQAAFYCEATDEYYSDTRVDAVQMANGGTWCEYAFADGGGTCERTDENYPSDELTEVIVNDTGGTETWGPPSVERHTWTCDWTYRHGGSAWVSNDVKPIKVYDAEGDYETWAPHIAETEAFVSDFDGNHYPNEMKVIIAGPRYVATHQEAEARAQSTAIVCIPSLRADHPGQLDLPFDPAPAALQHNAHAVAYDLEVALNPPAAEPEWQCGNAIADSQGRKWMWATTDLYPGPRARWVPGECCYITHRDPPASLVRELGERPYVDPYARVSSRRAA